MRWPDVTRLAQLILLAAGPLLAFGANPSLAQQPAAQQTAAPAPTNDWSIESVTVTAQAKGPAYWRATKGQAEVWILGTVEPIPKDFGWNQNQLAKLLDGTRIVLLSPRATASLFQSAWFLLTE